MRINSERLQKRIEAIAEIGKDQGGGWSRLAFSEKDMQARKLVEEMMQEAGLEVNVDPAGNIIGRLDAEHSQAPVVATGSHIDTVLNGGMFDGVAGVIGGIEVAHTIKENGYKVLHPIEVIVFADEEGVRFNSGLFGSRAIAGKLDSAEFSRFVDRDGITLKEALEIMGLDPASVAKAKAAPGKYKAFFELHVEQSIVLESSKKKVGIVDGIKGPYWLKGHIQGKANHAGSTPMGLRQDALVATGEFICAIEKIAKEAGDPLVATMGSLVVKPGAINTIPGRTEFTIDIRDVDIKRRSKVVEKIIYALEQIEKRRGVEARLENMKEEAPVKIKKEMVQLLSEICRQKDIDYTIITSGAFHDSLIMTEITDVGMIFIPSRGGVSHSPQEWTDWEDLALGTEVLLEAMLAKAN